MSREGMGQATLAGWAKRSERVETLPLWSPGASGNQGQFTSVQSSILASSFA